MSIPLSLWMYICFPICLVGFSWMVYQGLREKPPVSRAEEQGSAQE